VQIVTLAQYIDLPTFTIMNFPNDNSTQTGINSVSYTPTYANVNNPNTLPTRI
jgi:hypothetical protein